MKQAARRPSIDRRNLLKAGLVLSTAGLGFPAPAIAQGSKISYTLSWVPAGGNAFIYVARQLGFWKKRGIAVDISRGYGSLAAIQAVSQRRFDLGNAGTGVTILSLIKGLDLKVINTVTYDSGIGVIVRDDSPIKKPADLASHTVAATAAGSDTPFLASYFSRIGIPADQVKIVYVDAQIIEESVIARRVDAQVAIATSSVPPYVAQGIPIRFFALADVGLQTYGTGTVGSTSYIDENRSLVADFNDGLLEGLKFSLLNPEETQERFLREHEEIAISANAKRYTELGIGMSAVGAIAPESRNYLGYADPAKLDAQAALVHSVLAAPTDPPAPPAASYANYGLTEHTKLSAAEWQRVRDLAAPYAGYLGRSV
jgi:NitT/TauT family transport system substrate-binding protein